MKRWRFYAEKQIKTVGENDPKSVCEIYNTWERFANTGQCYYIACKFCPFDCTPLCEPEEEKREEIWEERKEILNGIVKEIQNKEVNVMKEVKEWDGNPREMWIWDSNEEVRKKAMVYGIVAGARFPVLCCYKKGDKGETITAIYKHCAEIEDEEPRRMTNYELALWMQEKPGRQVKYQEGEYCSIFGHHDYCLREEDFIVPPEVLVREGKGEWHQPFAETE